MPAPAGGKSERQTDVGEVVLKVVGKGFLARAQFGISQKAHFSAFI
jgi:hypothetical protein